MLSLNELRRLRGMLSLTCYCFLVKAMKTQRLSSLRYNAVVTEISEAYLRAGTEEPPDCQLALSGSLTLSPQHNFWALLKQASTSGIMVAFPTTTLGQDECRERYKELILTINASCTAAGLNLPAIRQELPPNGTF